MLAHCGRSVRVVGGVRPDSTMRDVLTIPGAKLVETEAGSALPWAHSTTGCAAVLQPRVSETITRTKRSSGGLRAVFTGRSRSSSMASLY